MSKTTVAMKILDLALQKYNEPVDKIGRAGLTIEIDETHLYTRKYNVGRGLEKKTSLDAGLNL